MKINKLVTKILIISLVGILILGYEKSCFATKPGQLYGGEVKLSVTPGTLKINEPITIIATFTSAVDGEKGEISIGGSGVGIEFISTSEGRAECVTQGLWLGDISNKGCGVVIKNKKFVKGQTLTLSVTVKFIRPGIWEISSSLFLPYFVQGIPQGGYGANDQIFFAVSEEEIKVSREYPSDKIISYFQIFPQKGKMILGTGKNRGWRSREFGRKNIDEETFLPEGNSVQFKARTSVSDTVDPTKLIWKVEGNIGTIDEKGIFIPTKPGKGKVIVTTPSGLISDSAEIMVTELKSVRIVKKELMKNEIRGYYYYQSIPLKEVLITPYPTTLQVRELYLEGIDTEGETVDLRNQGEWVIDSDVAELECGGNQSCRLKGKKEGEGKISVTFGKLKSTIDVRVLRDNIFLEITRAPKINETVTLTLNIFVDKDYPNVKVTFKLPKQIQLVSGSLSFKGSLKKETLHQYQIKIRPVKFGRYRILAWIWLPITEEQRKQLLPGEEISELPAWSDDVLIDVKQNKTEVIESPHKKGLLKDSDYKMDYQ